jgi:leucyl/phenylalanyl-tRNA--protein transferase
LTVYRLGPTPTFPPPEEADDDSGLLAIGGDLSRRRVWNAYQRGIFPWPHEGYPLLWFSPDPRMVLPVEALHVPRRLARTVRRGAFRVTADTAFDDVVRACAAARRRDDVGTWITPGMMRAYGGLHRDGRAHSVETWIDGRLAGGIYGVAVGRVFVAESMFMRGADGSKIALVALVRHAARIGFRLVDAQVHTDHVARFGFREWPRHRYLDALRDGLRDPLPEGPWSLDTDRDPGNL